MHLWSVSTFISISTLSETVKPKKPLIMTDSFLPRVVAHLRICLLRRSALSTTTLTTTDLLEYSSPVRPTSIFARKAPLYLGARRRRVPTVKLNTPTLTCITVEALFSSNSSLPVNIISGSVWHTVTTWATLLRLPKSSHQKDQKTQDQNQKSTRPTNRTTEQFKIQKIKNKSQLAW